METNVRDTSLLSYDECKKQLGADQQVIFETLLDLGPTHDNRIIEYLRQGEKIKPVSQRRPNGWEKSDITGRRNQLVNKGMVVDLGSYFGYWYGKIKKYHFWAIWNDARSIPPGWYRYIEDVPGYKGPKRQLAAAGNFKETLF